jgi:hypothetical protein
MSAGVSHGWVKRFTAAVMATNLALAFLGLCLSSCLAPAEAHACCRSKAPTISAETDGCWLDTDGVREAADGLLANSSLAPVMHPVSLNPPAALFHGAPRVAASPPLVLRV